MEKIKKSLYPKTRRINETDNMYVITEKLDGSNLGFFKLNGELLIAQRYYIFEFSKIDECKSELYKGLYAWLLQYGEKLKNALRETSGVFGEWLGMGRLKYHDSDLDKRFYIFAKANIDPETYETYNIIYDRTLFIYPFETCVIPEFLGIVPLVIKTSNVSIEKLNALYDTYTNLAGRPVEGFVISQYSSVSKYVRMKNGKLADHKP